MSNEDWNELDESYRSALSGALETAHPAVEQAGGDERDFQAEGAQEVPSPVSQEYDRHLISLLRKGEALPGHQEEAADEIERLRDWNDHLNNTVLPNILNPNFLMLMKGGERLLDLCTKDGKFIGVSLNDMKDVFDWMVTHARIAPDHAALAQPSQAIAATPTYQFQSREIGESDWAPCDFRWYLYCSKSPEMDTRVVEVAAQPSPVQAEAEVERPIVSFEKYMQVMYDRDENAKRLDAALAEVERLRQFERICEGLPQDAIDGGWTVQGIRGYAKLLEDQLKSALARVAELEAKLSDPTAVHQWQFSNAWFDGSEEVVLKAGKEGSPIRTLYAAPVAQAQHSVPGKYDDVLLPFLKSMEHELHANAGKGDRPGWLQMDRRTALLEIYYHLAKLQKATKDNDAAGIVEYAADVANMSMMLVDVCGLLAAAPGKEEV